MQIQFAALHFIKKKPLVECPAPKSMDSPTTAQLVSLQRAVMMVVAVAFIACPKEVQAQSGSEVDSYRSVSDQGLSSDAEALMAFKNSVESDPDNRLHDWLISSPNPCTWSGVECTDYRVSKVDLSNFGLECNFSSVFLLFGLEKLRTLVLKSNAFHGNMSYSGSGGINCSNVLETVDLSNNKLQGPLSGDLVGLCQNIAQLNLSVNELTDPTEIGSFGLGSLTLLDVSYNSLTGDSVLSSLFRNCKGLQTLNLAHNRISWFAADGLKGCSGLQYLDISFNNMSGNLSGLGDFQSLTALDLSSNFLTGELHPSLGNCKQLKRLNLSVNQFVGNVPSSLGVGLHNIESLLISNNKLDGIIPPELGNICKTLQDLDLSYNKISGTIPSTFSDCLILHTMNVSNNGLSGSFPGDVISRMVSLKNLVLSYNNISGALPVSISKFPSLEVLDLSSNHLNGTIPSYFCKSPSPPPLQRLYLQDNMLMGSVPVELADCTQMKSLDLSFNYLSGTIPASLGSLRYLQDLVMWLNKLEGVIPDELSNSQSLENLILDNNFITGNIPSSLKNCTNLVWLSLSNNRLTGTIPSWIGQLDNLAILQLGNNSLSGTIPPELGDCKSLIWIDLNSNKLDGSIPGELSKHSGKISAGSVSGKMYAFVRNEGGTACRGAGGLVEFAGIRPEQISRVPALHSCQFTRVYMGTTMYQFKNNGTLIFLDLSYNMLSGTIPEEIGSMYYLQVLNLGHNNLTGNIPSSLGGVKLVGLLDLSHNNLQGFIPTSLSGLSFMADLDVSNNNLTGSIPLSGQLSTFPASRYENNSGLCGVPLPPCPYNDGTADSEHSKPHRKQASLAASVATGFLASIFCIFCLIVVVIESRKHKKKEDLREVYMESLPNSMNGSWKITGVLEPLSINVATFEKPLRKLTFAHLLEATNGFNADSLIGSGGFGDVYKAQLKDGTVVAIKKLIHVSGQGDREFTAEMETIGKIKHRNLVPLLGYCKIGEERLLVYEYMRWGSLDTVLHNQIKGGIKLDWPARKKIAIGAARGLAFLHHNCIPHIIHRDMKSSNVLLDENLEARVSDFGMARLMNAMDTHLSVSTLAGTPGYVPPEYYQSFRCTTKGDVYSYGVILLELLTGKQPTDSVDFGDNNLVGWVKQHAKLKISDVFDPDLMKDPSLQVDLLQHLRIACECLDDRPWRRPTMIQVLAMFRELQKDDEDTELDSFSLVDVNVEELPDQQV